MRMFNIEIEPFINFLMELELPANSREQGFAS